ncbi:MAG: PASTA domain-containing protein [Streptococcaceae bacterium]|jgi:serine/threonine-protein kinase|nr:PASTA domain-containing protein [Streptococcaceae bacterium]
MSDFLSNFTTDNYTKEQALEQTVDQTAEQSDNQPTDQPAEPEKQPTGVKDRLLVKDQSFARKKWLKQWLIGGISLLAVIGIFCFYYRQTHVKLPDFTGKSISTAQIWADQHKVKLAVKRVYNFDHQVNVVIKAADKNRTIAKHQTVNLTVSLGADPKAKIELPDFTKLSLDETRKFIKQNKLDNTTLQLDYSETVAKDSYIKQAFANPAVSPDNFKRQDNLTLHYSKGKEPIVQNIDVPDFSGQTKEQIKTWSQEKGVKVAIEMEGSQTIEADKVITQSVAKGQKVSKADTIVIKLSLGKPIVVPDFSQFSFDEANSAAKELPVIAKQVYSDTIAYGGFIGQSVGAGTQYFAKDTLPDVTVTYSLGRVYIKDLAGQTEGELQATFYNDYRSKGANISYRVQYVTSSETKGTVVGQTALNEFVPLTYTVTVKISNGQAE